MAALFPGALDNLSSSFNDDSDQATVHSDHHNDTANAINAVEAEIRTGTVRNVKHFGVLGDGSTNDTAAIQAVLDTVAGLGGGTVLFPAGTYIMDEIHPGNNTTIRGLGNATILKHRAAAGDQNGIYTTSKSNVVVQDLVLDGNSQIGNNGLVFAGCTNCKGINVLAKNWNGYHFWLFDDSVDCAMEFCVADGVTDSGFEIDAAIGCAFRGCMVRNIDTTAGAHCQAFYVWGGASGVASHNSVINCIAEMPASPVGFVYGMGLLSDGSQQTSHTLITGCLFKGGTHGIRILGTASADETTAAELVVSTAITGNVFQGQTLHAIVAKSGIENLTITGNSFACAGTAQAIALGYDNGDSYFSTVRYVSIVGNTCRGGGQFVLSYGANALTITGNNIYGCVPVGGQIRFQSIIAIYQGIGGSIANNMISECGDPAGIKAYAIGLLTNGTPATFFSVRGNYVYDSRTPTSGFAQVFLDLSGTLNIWGDNTINILASTTIRAYDNGGVLPSSQMFNALDWAGANNPNVRTDLIVGPKGERFAVHTVEELLTIAAAASTNTVLDIPAGVVVLGVAVRVTTAIPTAATFTVTGATTATAFNTAAVAVALNSTDAGVAAGSYYNATAQKVKITPNLTPGANTGRVRVALVYYKITPPTS